MRVERHVETRGQVQRRLGKAGFPCDALLYTVNHPVIDNIIAKEPLGSRIRCLSLVYKSDIPQATLIINLACNRLFYQARGYLPGCVASPPP